MIFERCRQDADALREYVGLFAECFPQAEKLADTSYLRWLYCENPAGPVIGFDAREDGALAAHYVCVPATIRINGSTADALLSLNTATHPKFQGRGLFTKLAELTYSAAADEGKTLVYGVANANSTHGFVRKLGFALISPLESRVGVGRLGNPDWSGLDEETDFRHQWSSAELEWRLGNPKSRVNAHGLGAGTYGFSARTGRAGIRAWAEMPLSPETQVAVKRAEMTPRVWLGLRPPALGRLGLYKSLPERLRPSPLNLIVRGLRSPVAIEKERVFFNFLDFDAF